VDALQAPATYDENSSPDRESMPRIRASVGREQGVAGRVDLAQSNNGQIK
jgi:hypothetical protein